MYTSYSLPQYLVIVHILALQLFLRSVSSLNLTNAYLHHKCLVKEEKYQTGSNFEKNLNRVIKIISTDTFEGDDQIFRTYGKAPNSVTIIFQCRGDSYGSKWGSCFFTAVAELRRICRRNKEAAIWYDQCFLHVTPKNFSSTNKIDYENIFSMRNPNNVSGDTKSFNKKAIEFLHKLTLKALIPDCINVVFYAAGEEGINEIKLYAMVQCTKIIGECQLCLESAIKELSTCCSGKQGARIVLGISCNLRYELYPFLSK